jgi:hypothetical protein
MSLSNLGFFISPPASIISGIGAELDESSSDEGKYKVGTHIGFADGREYVRVFAATALAAGNPVQVTDVIAGGLINADVDAAQAIGTDTLTGTSDFTSYVNGGLEGATVWIDAGTGSGQVRYIKEVLSANQIRVTEDWTTALATDADYIVFRNWAVAPKATTAINSPGIAQYAIAINNYGWVQTKGFGHALADGSQDPLIAGEPIVVGTAVAGTVEGRTAAGLTAADLNSCLGMGLADVAALDILAPVYINPIARI